MTKSYLELMEDQFLTLFADLEADKAFLQKSLQEYKEAYLKVYPEAKLEEDDFSIALDGTDNAYIKFPPNVVCLHVGDLTDKSMGAGSTTAHNMELVRIMLNTHTRYPDRMYSLIGNRETTKRFRLKRELNKTWYEQVLNREAAELANDPDFAKKHTTQRPTDMIWVDSGKINFLAYLTQQKLPDDPSSITTTPKKDVSVKEKFLALSQDEQDILYLKWMFANSTGAPNLWNELNEELHRRSPTEEVTDHDVLAAVKDFFMRDEGIYHQYLKHCQVGLQIENTLFTHSGVHDKSFVLPKSLLAILDDASITRLFGKEVTRAKLLTTEVEAENIQLVLEVLNTAFRRVVLEISGKAQKTAEESAAIDTLIAMGLPEGIHGGSSVINVPVEEFSNPISSKTIERLRNNGTQVPAVTRTAFGHWPIRTPQFVKRLIDGTFFTSVRMDTCNFRKGVAAVALYMHKTKEALYMSIRGLNEEGGRYEAVPEVTNAAGVYLDPVTLQVRKGFVNTPGALVGCPVVNDDSTVSVLEKYDAYTGLYTTFRQGGGPKFPVFEEHIDAEAAKDAVARFIVMKQSNGNHMEHVINAAFDHQQPTAQPRPDARLSASFYILMLSVRYMNKYAKLLCALVLLSAVVAAAFAVAFGATSAYTIGAAAATVGLMAVSMFMYRSDARSVDRALQDVQTHDLLQDLRV